MTFHVIETKEHEKILPPNNESLFNFFSLLPSNKKAENYDQHRAIGIVLS